MTNDVCQNHGLRVCSRCIVVDDAARRMSGLVNAYITFTPFDELIRSCMAFRLDDGTTDGTLYPNRKVALAHQRRPCAVFYFRNCGGGVKPHDCAVFLALNRLAYENDRIAWTDPDSPDLIVSTAGYDHMRRWLS